MVSRGLSAWMVLLGVGAALPACATQHDTAQALTIAGAAAVVIGASMAADEQCYNAGPGEGGVQAYCAPGLSKGARTAGKGLAVAGVGLAAAGYALKPKGPDRWQRPAPDPAAVSASPYRLIRPDPAPLPPEAAPEVLPPEAPPEAPPAEAAVAPCRSSGPTAPAANLDASCSAAAPSEGSSEASAAPGASPAAKPAPGAPR